MLAACPLHSSKAAVPGSPSDVAEGPQTVMPFHLAEQLRYPDFELPTRSCRSPYFLAAASMPAAGVHSQLKSISCKRMAFNECWERPMKLPRRKFLHLAAGVAVLPTLSHVAWAQAYPSRPVRIVVGDAAGGAPDTVARLIGQLLAERLGSPVWPQIDSVQIKAREREMPVTTRRAGLSDHFHTARGQKPTLCDPRRVALLSHIVLPFLVTE